MTGHIAIGFLNLPKARNMASQYTSELPSLLFDPSISRFLESFYQISDTPDAHATYADAFTDDATLIMASKKGTGKDGR